MDMMGDDYEQTTLIREEMSFSSSKLNVRLFHDRHRKESQVCCAFTFVRFFFKRLFLIVGLG